MAAQHDDDKENDVSERNLSARVFKNRGALLSIPAVLLGAFGKPSAFSVAVGLPLALGGELIRCWAVGYSGITTRADKVTAPALVTAGPYAHVRNPLYLGNFITALGFAVAFTGCNTLFARLALRSGALGSMSAVYATIIPHEERYLRATFGAVFEDYCNRVPSIVPRTRASRPAHGVYAPSVIWKAESKTFATFGAMLIVLAVKALRS
ncbi:MAG: isoprenylcysteine carboxylmethyltransferase family protein [Candidatus Eremiobacteraeota bacterium]|nr:isoprenylcysteine carboxylmethyltransferase family protein [Candidatus Eremiobacteraeota bacterium]